MLRGWEFPENPRCRLLQIMAIDRIVVKITGFFTNQGHYIDTNPNNAPFFRHIIFQIIVYRFVSTLITPPKKNGSHLMTHWKKKNSIPSQVVFWGGPNPPEIWRSWKPQINSPNPPGISKTCWKNVPLPKNLWLYLVQWRQSSPQIPPPGRT